MTETIDNRCWEYYGYPNPEFMEPRLPWLGLLRALAERYKQAYGTITYDSIFDSDNPGGLYSGYDDPAVLSEYKSSYDVNPGWGYSYFYTVLPRVCQQCLNPAKLADVENITSVSDLMWTVPDLQAAAAELLQEDIITQSARLNPLWPLAWLKQQYAMVNLLKFFRADYELDRYYGYSIPSNLPTFSEALNSAKQNLAPYSGPGSWWFNVDIDHGGSGDIDYYGVIIEDFSECRVNMQGDSWLVAKITGADGNRQSFGLAGDKIRYGWNAIRSDNNGVFLQYDPAAIAESDIPIPDRRQEFRIGWRPENNLVYAFHDYSSSFYFKEETSA